MSSRHVLSLLAVLLAALGLALWWMRSRDPSEAAHVRARAEQEAPVIAAAELSAVGESTREHVDAAPPPALPVASPAAAQTQPTSAPAASELPPKDAHGELVLHVREKRSGRAIPDARVRMISLRRGDDRGAAYFWPDGFPAEGKSDVLGVARLEYPAWVHGLATTATVDFMVEHAEYPGVREEIEITGLRTEATVELEFGCYVVVSGWIGARDRVVVDVKPRVADSARVKAEHWVVGRDGRLGTNRLKAGAHALSIAWTSPEGKRYESRVESFALAVGEQREFALELVPASTVVGRIADDVPRPIENGEVMISVAFGGRGETAALRTYRAPIRGDGAFELADVPPGHAEVIAICNGWASIEVAASTPEQLDISGDDAASVRAMFDELRAQEGINQTFEVPSSAPLIVAMAPTAAVELTVVDTAGAPVAGADFAMWPNVHWRSCGYSSFFLDRTWQAETDANGRARLQDLPVPWQRATESYRVHKKGWLPKENEKDGAAQGDVELQSGATVELRIVLVEQ